MHPRTNERVLILTGASSGIGAALGAHAAARGWSVVLVARRRELVEALASGIRAGGGAATAVACDVTAREAPARIIEAAMREYGRIDVLINNAGAATMGALMDQSETAIEHQWQLHVAAPLRLAKQALAQLRQHNGGIVFLGSGLARVPAPFYGAYCAAKAAARAAAIQLRRELRRDGVFVTYVDPGVVDTGFSRAAGIEPHPALWHGRPDRVASRILAGIEKRAARVNAIPWQTAATIVGEWLPGLADAAMDRVVNTAPAAQLSIPQKAEPQETDVPSVAELSEFQTALAPVARRMERVKLNAAFVRDLLVPGTEIQLHDAAMRWAGMPNKNERAAMHDVLQALAQAGYLRDEGVETWMVLRAPE